MEVTIKGTPGEIQELLKREEILIEDDSFVVSPPGTRIISPKELGKITRGRINYEN